MSKEMEKRGYTWKLNRKYPSLKPPGMERYIRLRSLGKGYGEAEIGKDPASKDPTGVWKHADASFQRRELTGLQSLSLLFISDREYFSRNQTDFLCSPFRYSETGYTHQARRNFYKKEEINTREELAAYRKPLEEQVLSLMKERRECYTEKNRAVCA